LAECAHPTAEPSVNEELLSALVLAEYVLSHRPYSSALWPNGVHPNDGITKMRDAIKRAQEQ
jgi:hypothetical protein